MRPAPEALDDAVAEARRQRVEQHEGPRLEVRVDLGHGPCDRARDCVRDDEKVDNIEKVEHTGEPVSRDITSKNSVSVDTGKTTVTWMSEPTNSDLRHSARPTWANLVAAYALM